MSSEQNDFLFLDQQQDDEIVVEPSRYWDILIVDDDEEIHTVTKLALSGLEYGGVVVKTPLIKQWMFGVNRSASSRGAQYNIDIVAGIKVIGFGDE